MTKDEAIKRSNHAQNLLQDPLLNEVLDRMEHSFIEEWAKSAETDTAYREKLWGLHKLVKELRVQLNIVMQSGKVEKAQLEKLKAKS